ncbi:DUF1508 domain-containing protein [Salinimicrobium soli]|uniref:DUF1508 domain-containing protein n=1 Tax=Salinimicrobium soli TaxID=1254399 RepID=UPI003AAB6035
MSAFVISKRLNGDYKFTFASRRGKTIFTSIGCKDKADCELIIATIKNDLESFMLTQKRHPGGKFFFRLSRGGLVLANSRKFSTERMLQKGIDQFLDYFVTAEVLDFSDNEPVFSDAEEDSE